MSLRDGGDIVTHGIDHVAGLACPACNVVYPVRDDIPIMLVDAAVERARWDEEHKG